MMPRRFRLAVAALLACLVPLLLRAETAPEFVALPGLVDDETFYRAVACAALPGQDCLRPLARWSDNRAQRLTVGLAGIDPDFPIYKLGDVRAGLDAAIAEINATGAQVTLLRRADGLPADIPIYLTGAPRGGRISGTGYRGLDGTTIQAGLVTVWWQDDRITSAAIALSRDVRRRSIRSVLLEELVQALGLSTDIRSPAYARRSIFDEDSNAVIRLTGQDAEALRRHYPVQGAFSRSSSK